VRVSGREPATERGAPSHPAVAISPTGAYRHGTSEPIRAYFGEIGVAAASAADSAHFFRRSPAPPAPKQPGAEPAEVRAAGLAVAAPIAPSRRGAAVIGEIDGAEPEEASRSWSLKPRWPSLLTGGSRAPSEAGVPRAELPPPVAAPSVTRSMRMPGASQARAPMLGRLRRELQIWYWRRGAGNALDKKHPSE